MEATQRKRDVNLEIMLLAATHQISKYEARLLRKKFRAKRSDARRNDIPFDLTLPWFIEQYKKGCAVTGAAFNLEKPEGYFHPRGRGHNKRYPGQLSFHRAKPELGYIIGNTYVVLLSVNDTIGSHDAESLMQIAAFHWVTNREVQPTVADVVRLDDYRNPI